MNKETVATWVGEHGPCSSLELRRKVGVITKFTPISSRLSYLESKQYAKVHIKDNVKVYSLTVNGKKWIKTPGVIHLVQSIDAINATDYGTGQKKQKPTAQLNLDPAAENAMNSFVGLLDQNKKAEALIRGIMLQCQNYLDKGESDEQI